MNDDTKSLKFGKTMMTGGILKNFADKGTLNRDLARLSTDEKIPKPEHDECVVFKDYFTAGLRFPVQDLLEEILSTDNIEMHHLTTNGISKFALFIWVVRSQEAILNMEEQNS